MEVSVPSGLNVWIPVVVAIIALVGVVLVPIINTTLAYRNAKAAALAAAEVAETLKITSTRIDRKLDALATTAGATYKLADGRLSAAQEKIDSLEQLLLEATGRIPTGEPTPHTKTPGQDTAEPPTGITE